MGRCLMRLGCTSLKAGIIIVGLSNSGKTTIVHTLSKEPTDLVAPAVAPTVGFNIEKFKWRRVKITVLDMSGQTKYQKLWEHYYQEAQGIIFVVDAADRARFPEARGVLDSVLSRQEIKGLPLLVMCNKTDLANAMEPYEVANALGISKITGWDYHIQACSAVRNQGIEDGMTWLCDHVRSLL